MTNGVKSKALCSLVAPHPVCSEWMTRTDRRLMDIEHILDVLSEDMKALVAGVEIRNASLKRLEQRVELANTQNAKVSQQPNDE